MTRRATPVLTWDVACSTCGVPGGGGPCLGPQGDVRRKFHVARTRAASAAEAARRRKAALEDGAP